MGAPLHSGSQPFPPVRHVANYLSAGIDIKLGFQLFYNFFYKLYGTTTDYTSHPYNSILKAILPENSVGIMRTVSA